MSLVPNGFADGIQSDSLQAQRKKHDKAYVCFLAPALASMLTAVANIVPMDTGTAGGVGFLVLIPLSLLSLVAIPIGMFYSVVFWKDRALAVLSVVTVLIVLQMMLEIASPPVANMLFATYGLLVVIAVTRWFFVRRKRFYP